MKLPIYVLNAAAELAARQARPVNNTLVPNPPLPPQQELCTSEIYCPGPLLHAVQLAAIYPDSKTFVDKPTTKPEREVLDAFSRLGDGQGGNITQGEIVTFVNENFGEVGSELYTPDLGSEFNDQPQFLNNVTSDIVVKAWMQAVHENWPLLTRQQNTTGALCDGCVTSFVPFKENRPFIIPGGRFGEQYYFDTYFALQGLLKSELWTLAKSVVENTGDLVDILGHVPNANRVYYNNRSQPPFFIQMVDAYITATNDNSVLPRLLPQMEKELQFWIDNRTISVTSPASNKTHKLAHYRVNNSAPRPESYREDYETVEEAGQEGLDFSNDDKALLYSDLASGAESGHDYSATRWSTRPTINLTDTIPAQRYLNTHAQIPVDLNALLYRNEITLAKYLAKNGSSESRASAERHRQQAQARKDGILDLLWDRERLWFYDFNMTANALSPYWTAAGAWPYWANIIPTQFLNSKTPLANRSAELQRSFGGIRYIIERYNGSLPTTLVETGQQWDFPNVWAPHSFIALQALRQLPSDLANGTQKAAPDGSYALLPTNGAGNLSQVGVSSADGLPRQSIAGSNDTYVADLNEIGKTSPNNDTAYTNPLVNVGDAALSNTTETWRDTLVRAIANRYVSSAMCSWHATGGTLNVSDSDDPQGFWKNKVSDDILDRRGIELDAAAGAIYEKFNTLEIDSAGAGGEYKVQIGFGWSSGLALYLGSELGNLLQRPLCPDVDLTTSDQSDGTI